MSIFILPSNLCPSLNAKDVLEAYGESSRPLIEIIGPLLSKDETLVHLVIQDKLRAAKLFPSALVLTDRRIMIVNRKFMGQAFLDLFWSSVEDAHLEESWGMSTFAVKGTDGSILSLSALPPVHARPAYAFAQRAEELVSEWRRDRKLEEDRAKSRGVDVSYIPSNAPVPPSTPSLAASIPETPEVALERLQKLFENNLITDVEYLSKRKEILSRL